MNVIEVAYTDSIPLGFFWTEKSADTEQRIALVGTNGQQLNDSSKQLCYFTLVNEATGQPVSAFLTARSLFYDETNEQAVYEIQQGEGPDANGCVPSGSYIAVGEYDSRNTTDMTITAHKKKAYVRVVVANRTADYDVV